MARGEVTGRAPIDVADQADAYSIDEFCSRHRFSVAFFYKMKPLGLMPVTFRVGTRVLISREAAEAWRRARENDTQMSPPHSVDTHGKLMKTTGGKDG